MHRIYNCEADTFLSLFERKEEIYNNDTHQKEHNHISSCKTNLGKSLKYNGAVICNIF